MTKREQHVYNTWNIEMGEQVEEANRNFHLLQDIAEEMGVKATSSASYNLEKIIAFATDDFAKKSYYRTKAMAAYTRYCEANGKAEALRRYLEINRMIK